LRISKSQADKLMDTKAFLKEKMRELYLKESLDGTNPICTKEELVEFLEDGNLILDYFQKPKNFNSFFSLTNDELVAIEQPINTKIAENVSFLGFLDMVVRNKVTGRYRIIDFKTSTMGWNKYQKADDIKNAQILLYKKFYAELLNISQDMIDAEFIILKRKVSESTDYTIPRISKHIPASGKPSVNKAWTSFREFVDSVFDENGEYRKVEFVKNPGKNKKNCKWCEFSQRGICDGKI
jgi:hypothetical protein